MTATLGVNTTPVGHNALANKHLIDSTLWERLVGRIVKDEGMERPLAERIMNEALGFLRLCAAKPNGGWAPSPMVDIGWHTFILYTRGYTAWCMENAGRYIHHEPNDLQPQQDEHDCTERCKYSNCGIRPPLENQHDCVDGEQCKYTHCGDHLADAEAEPGAVARTVAAMQVHGITVDKELWGGAAGCTKCNSSCKGICGSTCAEGALSTQPQSCHQGDPDCMS